MTNTLPPKTPPKVRLAFVSRTAAVRLGCLAVVVALAIGCALAMQKDVSAYLLHRLTYARHLPEAASTSNNDVVYVLGGTPNSLKAKFRIASQLLRDGKAAQVLVLRQEGIMAFDPVLGRNLSADEWVVDSLGNLGVAVDAVQFIDVKEGFFGTWSEAKGLSRLVEQRGYRRIILVTSPFHSRRVWESFSRTIDHSETRVFLCLSDERAYLRHVLVEYVKLLLYRALLF